MEHKCLYKWELTKPVYRSDIQIKSELFAANYNKHNVKWQLIINWEMSLSELNMYEMLPYVALKLVSADEEVLRISYQLFIGDSELQMKRVTNSGNFTVKPGSILSGRYIRGIKNNRVIVIVKITMMENSQPETGIITRETDMSSLIKDLGRLFNDVEFSDVTVIAGDSKFPVHKNILALRSDVFAAMFRHELEEKKTNQIIIDDFDPSIIKEMLCYIYTGQSSKISEMAAELLAAADKYAVEGLKNACIHELNSKLTIETAVPTLISADMHNALQLKQHAIDFINANSAAIIKTDPFRDMVKNFPHLALDIFEAQQRSG